MFATGKYAPPSHGQGVETYEEEDTEAGPSTSKDSIETEHMVQAQKTTAPEVCAWMAHKIWILWDFPIVSLPGSLGYVGIPLKYFLDLLFFRFIGQMIRFGSSEMFKDFLGYLL